MATEYLNREKIYSERATAGAEPSISAELAHMSFSEFAEQTAREAAEARVYFAQGLLEDDEDE